MRNTPQPPAAGNGIKLVLAWGFVGIPLVWIIAGGPSPFIATALFAAFASSLPIALYILACAVVGIIATSLLTDYTNKDISEEYDQIQTARAAAT